MAQKPLLQPQFKYGRRLFVASDDTRVMGHIQETHKPDGRVIDVKLVLTIVEQIFSRAAPTSMITTPLEGVKADDKLLINVGTLDSLGYTIHKVSCEISCRCSGSGDTHETTMALLHGPLSHYAWDGKAVLALAAFAMSYGEFCLTGQLHAENPLARSVALLKQMPEWLEHVEALKPRFEALSNLVKALLALTKCMIEFNELPEDYIAPEFPALATVQSHIPTSVYWIIKSVVTSSSQMIGLIGMGHEYPLSTSESWELSTLAHKVKNINDHLRKLLETCLRHIDEKRQAESYQMLEHAFQTPHLDNTKLIHLMFPSKDDCPLILRFPSEKVHVNVLHGKMLVLLISDMQIMPEELSMLVHVYGATHDQGHGTSYDVVWVPIVDHVEKLPTLTGTTDQFKPQDRGLLDLAANMPWYTVYPQPHHNSAFVKYVHKEWHFSKKPILVVLDAQGKVTNQNAMYMVYIWGNLAYPFSNSMEEALWKEEAWKLELVVDHCDDVLSSWIAEGRYICLYGGEDIDWIRYFTKKMKEIMRAASITVEMIYAGKNQPKMPVKKNIETIKKEKLSTTWACEIIWFFWKRLESMMHSKMQSNKKEETDQILHEVITLLTYGNSHHGWAMISKGSLDIVKAEGPVLGNLLTSFDSWKGKIPTDGFIKAIEYGLDPLKTADHCVRLVLPSSSPVHNVSCPECRKVMERYLLFQCCDAPIDSSALEAHAQIADLPTAVPTQAAAVPLTAAILPAALPRADAAQVAMSPSAGAAPSASTPPTTAAQVATSASAGQAGVPKQ